jgi:hypothetical protein
MSGMLQGSLTSSRVASSGFKAHSPTYTKLTDGPGVVVMIDSDRFD